MKICFVASPKAAAQEARDALVSRYGQVCAQQADCFVAVGGDGAVLKALQIALACERQAVFGMRAKGSVGHWQTRTLLRISFNGCRTPKALRCIRSWQSL